MYTYRYYRYQGPARPRLARTFRAGGGPPLPPHPQEPTEADHYAEHPVAIPSLAAHVAVPFLQATLLAVGLTATAASLAPLAGLSPGPVARLVAPPAWTALLWWRIHDHARLLRAVEEWSLETNGPEAAGEKPPPAGPPAERIVLVGARPAHQVGARSDDLPTPRPGLADDFRTFVRRCAAVGTAWALWQRHLSRERYLRFRDVLLRLGWARWRDPAKPSLGWELTAPPDEILAAILTETHPGTARRKAGGKG